jgi:transcriptional regulator with XRE-family HTH domain
MKSQREIVLKDRLRAWRIVNELTLQVISDLTRLSVPMLSRLERGERQPHLVTKIRIARRLGVNVSELLEAEPLDDGVEGLVAEVDASPVLGQTVRR